jgi:hypothetical protein
VNLQSFLRRAWLLEPISAQGLTLLEHSPFLHLPNCWRLENRRESTLSSHSEWPVEQAA